MTEEAMPSITGIHHFSPTVTDVEASVAWYQRLFGMDRVPVPFPHYEREDTGYAVVLIEPRSGVLIGLHNNEGNRGESFDECRTGLDHCSLGVASRDELAAWVAGLDELGIQHTGIRDEKEPSAYSTVVFRDPTTSSLSSCAWLRTTGEARDNGWDAVRARWGGSTMAPSAKALRLRRWLWRDNDLADAEVHAWWCAERSKPFREYLKKPDGDTIDVKPALELAETAAKAKTERETNLNTRGAAVAAVAGIIVPIATALANPLFTTKDQHWVGFPRNLAEYLFVGALVCVVSAMVMAVVGVLRPGRGGQTKNAVGEAVVSVWRREEGYVALAKATDRKIAIFRLDHLLQAIPTWHYRNRSKARLLRRAWMFLMLGIILIGSVGVIFLTELSQETIWEETAGAVAVSLIVIWLLLRFDLVRAGRPHKQANSEEQRKWARREAKKIQADWKGTDAAKEAEKDLELLGSSATAATNPAKADPGGPAATDNSKVSDAALLLVRASLVRTSTESGPDTGPAPG
jgi:glyoxylase I family protein